MKGPVGSYAVTWKHISYAWQRRL